MKIGILTYHRNHNYGALLQAVAIRYFIKSLGHEVYYIDYWPKYHKDMYALFSFRQWRHSGIIRYVIKDLIWYLPQRRKRIQTFKNFIDRAIEPFCKPYESPECYDTIVYGSDQIWRKQHLWNNRFDTVYLGRNRLNARRHVAYAASMGNVYLNENDAACIKDTLRKFAGISVRESALQERLSTLGIEASTVVDPVLLLDGDEWEALMPVRNIIPRRYMLYYRLGWTFDETVLERIAARNNCELITIGGAINRTKGFSDVGPEEFLSLVRYADFVFTSSYHGLVFSLIFNKPFYVSFPIGRDGRADSLLGELDLKDRILHPKCRDISVNDSIDYNKVNKKIGLLRSMSKKFLSGLLYG